MSSFLGSSRRRFSQPEKPQPRFEWRMRVHSLMMDERENYDPPFERKSQRYDAGRPSRGLDTDNEHKQRKEEKSGDDSTEEDVPAYRRRSRFLRTKSEGYLKVRLRLSKFSDVSKSQDEPDPQDESRHLRDHEVQEYNAESASYRRRHFSYQRKESAKENGENLDHTLSKSHEETTYHQREATSRNNVQDTAIETMNQVDTRKTSLQLEAYDSKFGSNDIDRSTADLKIHSIDKESQASPGAENLQDAHACEDLKLSEASGDIQAAAATDYITTRRTSDQIARRASKEDNYNASCELQWSCEDIELKIDGSQGAIPKRYSSHSSSIAAVQDHVGRDEYIDECGDVPESKSKESAEPTGAECGTHPISYDDNSSCALNKTGQNSIKINTSDMTKQLSDVNVYKPNQTDGHFQQKITQDKVNPEEIEYKVNPTSDKGDAKQNGFTEAHTVGGKYKSKDKTEYMNTHSEEHKIIVEELVNSLSKSSSEDHGDADDIESLIEQIIAEEEAMLDGKAPSAKLIQESLKHINKEDLSALRAEVQTLQNEIDICNNEGVPFSRSTSQKEQRSSSLPSCNSDDQQVQAVMPYSSSCPHTYDAYVHKQQATKKEEDDEEEDFNSWAYLPVILMEDILTLLSPKERHQASQVCRQWYDLFYSPRVWETFILLERTLTKKRFNLYKGYQRELCPGKTQLCFRRVGSFFKRIVVTPISDYFNLYEFLRILAAFLQFQEDHGQIAMPLLHTFDFTFACASRSEGVEMVHGTGGQILEMIIQLLVRMNNLKHLKLNQLLVDVVDVPSLFDAIANCFGECLSSLEILNVTKVPLPLTDLSLFRNLIKLTISPQHLNDEVALLLSGLNIMQLHLLQDPYTCECEPVSSEAWKLVREIAPWLQVYLEVVGTTRSQVLIQPRAPVYGVFLRTPYSRLTNDLAMSLVEQYSKTLRYFVQERLPRVHGPRGFHHRSDSSFLFLVRRCSVLQTLVIRERISTSTLVLLAHEGRRLHTLLVRKYGLIKRCDWPKCGEMSKEFFANLKSASLDYSKCTDEICKVLKRRWKPMEDKPFMRLKIVPRLQVC
ncbi:filaggrin [Biomphalaria pfeifferi]|uniref:Filaggrin n=1 Tax=Biomphalaria pfeifferi TaxID=112525 RepID=A0AAD8F051_BIOPF|nr:filaggrin [Biomphalaria pfeifferi]